MAADLWTFHNCLVVFRLGPRITDIGFNDIFNVHINNTEEMVSDTVRRMFLNIYTSQSEIAYPGSTGYWRGSLDVVMLQGKPPCPLSLPFHS